MTLFFSPTTCAFYDDAIHGRRQIEGELAAAQVKAGRKPPMIDNPDCKLPADAVEVTEARWRELMDAQADGKKIVARAGRPVAVDPVASAEEIEVANRRRRDQLLRGSDWTQLADVLAAEPEYSAAMALWRQALRDLDLATGDFPEQPTR